jgi:enterochelin esterase family protein
MTKDDKGVWSITVGPLAPDIYSYNFNIDDLSMESRTLFIHGAGSANYEMSTVPHGTVSKVWFESATYGDSRRMVVYTPPGYETSTVRYPVLYLLHGGDADELTWSETARAPQIFDNLIAQGKMVPSIVVMPNGANGPVGFSSKDVTLPNAQRRGPGLSGGGPGGPGTGGPGQAGAGKIGRVMFQTSLVQEIIPFIDKIYRTKTDRDDRAIAGQSGGAGESIIVSMNNLDKFSWLGAFSPGWPDVPQDFWVNIPMPADVALRRSPEVGHTINPVRLEELVPTLGPNVNNRLNLFYFGVGDAEGLVETEQAIRKIFDEKGVKYLWVEKHDYAHDWDLWRINLQEFASKMFKSAK